MKLSKLSHNIINKKVATVIKSKDGHKLLDTGTVLTKEIIEKLSNYNMNALYIEDENTDIELEETIKESTRAEIQKRLNKIFSDIKKGQFDERNVNDLIRNYILIEINGQPVSIPMGRIMNENDIAEHTLNVCLMAIATARKLGLDEEKIEILAKASLLHDIGKVIEGKGEKRHEFLGYEFLKAHISSPLVYTTVRYHHETIDGKGPQKQSVNNQHDMVKIISLVNFYENLLRWKKLLPHHCFEYVQGLVNVKFDSNVFDAFSKAIYIYPVGLPVGLSNNEEGIVVRQNVKQPLRPIVRAVNREYNLLEHLTIFLDKVLL